MRCPHCGHLMEPDRKRDDTRPLFAIVLILLIVFFWLGFRISEENRSLKSDIEGLERKVQYYESIVERYEKAIEGMGNPGQKEE